MATLVFFHAHPDDECIATGGTMAMAAADGHRVVLVTATKGELGEPTPGILAEGEELWTRRVSEVEQSARVLGAARGEFLGYRDSGMIDTQGNDDPTSFWQADLEEAAQRLADLLIEEEADVLTIYDEHGNYGHPDHIQVHRVGARAAVIAGTKTVLMATINRDSMIRLITAARDGGMPGSDQMPDPEGMDMGEPEARITHAVDVTSFIGQKREAMRCHKSQIAENSFFLEMPDEVFAGAFGTEWYVALGEGWGSGPDAWSGSIVSAV